MGKVILISVLVVIVFLIVLVVSYNKLVQAKLKVANAWSTIDVQLLRRFDLIPNLNEMVKGYMKHEKDTLIDITKLRSAYKESDFVEEKVKTSETMEQYLKQLVATVEYYPELKSNETVKQIMFELKETENKIAFSRQFYNDAVYMYNQRIECFPQNIVAKLFHFKAKQNLEIPEVARTSMNLEW